ncbi:Nitrate reductase delta subunit [Acididesulfobacillus acetoxydans]|uniref:Nitrate reductase delta subunit n=1 Tax=Acididesulfobacillus acetoxydans TaxID=1561005 RepID=A0A8S0Y3V9_9FIRM|nr:molecular chaperone TorD family protein [Acididesulfobacillus acetoxydans]CAA7602475.1 Nitrate reductase delta subunit [Acididesulfobacillus acetoxydans]CEJ05930.1 Nitrate reductase delta subunit [Acididesulfobacillus acetoxydans]
MEQETAEELYLSFAGIFQRPRPDIARHLEELIDLWAQEISSSEKVFSELREFCRAFPAGEVRENALWKEYIPLFETGRVEAPPYASVYLDRDGLVLGCEAEEVRKFYLSLGYGLRSDQRELPDHLGVELEFLARLAGRGSWDAVGSFRKSHLRPFLRAILPKIRASERPVYSQAAELLASWQLGQC